MAVIKQEKVHSTQSVNIDSEIKAKSLNICFRIQKSPLFNGLFFAIQKSMGYSSYIAPIRVVSLIKKYNNEVWANVGL